MGGSRRKWPLIEPFGIALPSSMAFDHSQSLASAGPKFLDTCLVLAFMIINANSTTHEVRPN